VRLRIEVPTFFRCSESLAIRSGTASCCVGGDTGPSSNDSSFNRPAIDDDDDELSAGGE
jgi:hypothetical protein